MQAAIPHPILNILMRLNDNRHEAFLVGGCTRDFLLSRAIHDFDLTTSATPDEMIALFADIPQRTTGLKHGTLTLLLPSGALELTTYRVDAPSTDARHPDAVTFTRSLHEDLARRDFTINAIAYHPAQGFVDPYGGRTDLSNGVIRAIGNPPLRFQEDALRILRAVRFAAVLGFPIEDETKRAMIEALPLLAHISAERKADELSRTLLGRDIRRVLAQYGDIIAAALGMSTPHSNMHSAAHTGPDTEHQDAEQDPASHTAPYHQHIARSAARVAICPAVLPTRLAALLLDFSDAEVRTILSSLKLAKNLQKAVRTLHRYQHLTVTPDARSIARALSLLGEAHFFALLDLQDAMRQSSADARIRIQSAAPHTVSGATDDLRKTARSLIDAGLCYETAQLALSGNDLIALGLRGAQIGQALATLLDAVVEQKVANHKASLITYLQRQI